MATAWRCDRDAQFASNNRIHNLAGPAQLLYSNDQGVRKLYC